MTCPVCGNQYPCTHTRKNAALLAGSREPDFNHSSSQSQQSSRLDRQQWRNEIITRVQQQHARRRKEPDPNAMEFDFPVIESPDESGPAAAADLFTAPGVNLSSEAAEDSVIHSYRHEPPKIIRFPGSAIPAIAERLAPEAAPVQAEPRILDANDDSTVAPPAGHVSASQASTELELARPPEQLELLPSFDDIHLDESHQQLLRESEIIPQPAPLHQRAVAMAMDLGLVLLALVTFATTFKEIAEDNPSSRLALLCGFGIAGVLWLVYQYLFLVYGRGTLGMRLLDLELTTFDGKRLTGHDRRYRALASVLSAFSLGLGYAWALVDEDQLGWHDRITQTVERSRYAPPAKRHDIWEE
jgi:uncharacterized RDD family membrane protein YckC